MGEFLRELVARGTLGKAQLFSGQWLRFEDSGGLGFAQPDHYILGPSGVLLIECKLTQTADAWEQLDRLYFPLLQALYGLPILRVQACKNLVTLDDSVIHNLAHARDGATWHWIGG